MSPTSVTIKDIARLAGVSHTTVSRALRNHPAIAPETVKRIREIASQQGYMVSAAARSLKTSRSQILGIILSYLDDPYFSKVLEGIEDTLQPEGYSLFVAASHADVSRERAVVDALIEHRVDGVILCAPPFRVEHSRRMEGSGLPLVAVNNQGADEYHYSVDHSDESGACEVVRYLINLGHTQIAYLGNLHGGRTNFNRQAGFMAELAAAGLPARPEWIYNAPDGRPEGGYAGAQYFLGLTQRPTAIQCFNDLTAIGLMRGLQEAGVRVPQDCSVVGFDNIDLAAYLNPPLTTYDQPRYELGVEAARLMLRMLRAAPGEPWREPEHRLLPGRLVERSSAARACIESSINLP
jgi:DNA-binding LacI/PurR family transcriptional regulator